MKHVIEDFVVQDTKFNGQENSRTALELIETTAQIVNSTLYPIGEDNTDNVPHCSFVFYGGAIIATNSVIDISQSKFEHNRADHGGVIYTEQHSNIIMSD